jgi:hypothetical protein
MDISPSASPQRQRRVRARVTRLRLVFFFFFGVIGACILVYNAGTLLRSKERISIQGILRRVEEFEAHELGTALAAALRSSSETLPDLEQQSR